MNNVEVRYNNDLNKLPLPHLTGRQMDLFFSILAHTNEKNKSFLGNFFVDRQVEIPFNRFVNLCRADDWKKSFHSVIAEIDNFLKLIVDYKIFYEDERAKYAFVCFEKAKWDKQEQIIKITFQKDFYEMIINYKLGFTRFELAEFLTLSSEYTKKLYTHLKQFRKQGYWNVKWEYFMQIMQIPQSYNICDIDKQILKPAIKELTKERNLFDTKRVPFKNLQYEKIKEKGFGGRGQGGKVVGIKFTFMPETKEIETKLEEENPKNNIDIEKLNKLYKGRNYCDSSGNYKIIDLIKKGASIYATLRSEAGHTMGKDFTSVEELENALD